MLLGLLIAALGGWLASLVGVPLPWMLGAIGSTLIAALVRAPIQSPVPVLPPMRVILGVLMGSSVTPALFNQLGALGLTLALVPIYVALSAGIGGLYFARVARMSRSEAFFAALPGGLYTMVAFAEELGINVRRIALNHTLRVTLIVIALPLLVQALIGQDLTKSALTNSTITNISLEDTAILVACGLAGWWASERFKVPGGIMIMPMILTATVELSGLTSAAPPMELVILAQVVMGAGIGGRFLGIEKQEILTAFIHACGYVALMLSITVGIAVFLSEVSGISIWSGILAFAPGGLAEMSLVALAMGLSAGLLATVHTLRILLVVVAAPFVYTALRHKLED